MQPKTVADAAESSILYLVEKGLLDDQNMPYLLREGKSEQVTFANAGGISAALKSRPYKETYDVLNSNRVFTARLPDGALLQLLYRFESGKLLQHRLAYMPSPYLIAYQDDPELYETEIIYAEIVAREIVPFPIRFDFDVRDGVFQELSHPCSHLTLGQYGKCRIPVTAPLTPSIFISFIFRHFYNSAFEKYGERFPKGRGSFEDSIFDSERLVPHFLIPNS